MGQFAGFAHQLVVRHRICEHGKLVHISSDSRGALALDHDSGRTDERSPGTADSDDRGISGQEHDHCTATAHRRQEAALDDDGGTTAGCGAKAKHMGADDPQRSIGIAAYRLAPKNSPPA